jgi:hypothetical protein
VMEMGEVVIAKTNTLILHTGRVSFRVCIFKKVHYSSRLNA